MNICVVYSLGLLRSFYKHPSTHLFVATVLVSLSKYLGVELLYHTVDVHGTLQITAKEFPKAALSFYAPLSMVKGLLHSLINIWFCQYSEILAIPILVEVNAISLWV